MIIMKYINEILLLVIIMAIQWLMKRNIIIIV